MEEQYICQNPHMTTSSTRALVDGEEMTVSVEVLECELVALDTSLGSIKLRFKGAEIDGAKSLFVNDSPIAVTFAAGPPPPPGRITL
jgi:hypothetical protein